MGPKWTAWQRGGRSMWLFVFGGLIAVIVVVALFAGGSSEHRIDVPSQTVTSTGGFNGGLNTNNGTITNLSNPADPKITMRAVTTAGGASYARGLVSKNTDGSGLKIVVGDTLSMGVSVIFRDTGRYTSVARFDSYVPFAGAGSIFGIERWSNNTLRVISTRYDAGSPLLDMPAPGLTIAANTRYDLRLEAKLSPTAGGGYTRLFVNGIKRVESAAANIHSGRYFTKLRAGVVAVGTSGATVEFGDVRLAPAAPAATPTPTPTATPTDTPTATPTPTPTQCVCPTPEP